MNEIQRRRTFAIISHPDAGKTTLTEKFLLFGGQIQVAGAVKNNKIRKTATSDWMDIEKQRGISVSTSVMEFDYLPDGQTGDPYKVNILDTPGHQDFAEDTYRTLTAVDSAIIVVDSAKGVEAQTRKLMEVCRMRNTPVIIFINKMDREGRDPFDVLDELEEELKIHVRPLSWPLGQGARFKGVYNIYEHQLNLFTPNKQRVTEKVAVDIQSQELDERVGEREASQLREELELVDGVYPEFDVETYRSAEVARRSTTSVCRSCSTVSWRLPRRQSLPRQRSDWCSLRSLSLRASSSRLPPTSTLTTVRASPSARFARASLCATSLTTTCAWARPCASLRLPSLWRSARAPSTRLILATSWVCQTMESSRLEIL